MSSQWRLLADVGGTNVRFGRVMIDGTLADCHTTPIDAHTDFNESLNGYLARTGHMGSCSGVAIAAAGPATPDMIRLTNNSWIISRRGIDTAFARPMPLRLLNDLEAVAAALPYLADTDIEWLGSKRPPAQPSHRMLAVNVGTGFGAATVIRSGPDWVTCPGEAGHMALGAVTEAELRIFQQLSTETPSIEDILSGAGVIRLHDMLDGAPDRGTPPDQQVAGILLNAAGTDAAFATSTIFTNALARVCANLVLSTAAWDGLYLSGSVAKTWAKTYDERTFRATMISSPQMMQRLHDTPIAVITHDWPAFVGLANLTVY